MIRIFNSMWHVIRSYLHLHIYTPWLHMDFPSHKYQEKWNLQGLAHVHSNTANYYHNECVTLLLPLTILAVGLTNFVVLCSWYMWQYFFISSGTLSGFLSGAYCLNTVPGGLFARNTWRCLVMKSSAALQKGKRKNIQAYSSASKYLRFMIPFWK